MRWGRAALTTGVVVWMSASAPLQAGPAEPGGHQAVRTPALRTLTVAATGDILTEDAVLNAGVRGGATTGKRYAFSPLFAEIAPIVSSAQLAICHMEIPITDPGVRAGYYGRSPYGGNLLAAPYELAHDIGAAGFDRCSTASNHSYDIGAGGIATTLQAFDDAGVTHVGTARTPAEAQPQTFVVSGVRVAHLSYTRKSNTVLPNEPWRLEHVTDPRQIAADVGAVRAAGAEIVIVSLHIGRELLTAPAPDDRAFIETMTATAPIDLVIEHGPHVIQPVEVVNGAIVYWSVGNLLSGMGLPNATRYGPPTLDGLLAWVTFRETSPGRFSAESHPVLVCNEQFGRVIYPAVTAIGDTRLAADVRSQLAACIARGRGVIPYVE